MELSETARDILERLPSGSVVYEDNEGSITIQLSEGVSITSSMLSGIKGCRVNFRTRLLSIREPDDDDDDRLPTSPRQCTLQGTTESELHAVEMVREMGCIDTDQLVPQCTISTASRYTTLFMSKLLEVDNDALRSYLSPHAAHYTYNLSSRKIEVVFPAVQKRKAR